VKVFPLLTSLAFPLLALVADGGSSFMPIKMEVEHLDPAIDELVPANTKVEKLAEGFVWSEGPTWFDASVLSRRSPHASSSSDSGANLACQYGSPHQN
jgi:hypothetical protein